MGVLALGLAAPLAPPAVAITGLLAASLGWLLLRPPRRELWTAGPALVLAAALAVTGLGQERTSFGDAAWRSQAERSYAALWAGLTTDARRAAGELRELRGPVVERRDRFDLQAREEADLAAFERLEGLAARAGGETSLLWVTGDGDPTAWAGPGLLHKLVAPNLPRAGAGYVAGFTAVSLLAVEPLDAGRPRSSRALAGRSLPTDRLPFEPPGGGSPAAFRWSLAEAASSGDGVISLAPAGVPAMLIESVPAPAGRAEIAAPWRRRSWAALGFALLALAVMRTAGLLLAPERRQAPWLAAAILAAAGVVAWGTVAALAPSIRLALGVAGALAAFGLRGSPWPWGRRWAVAFSAGSVGLIALGGWFYQRQAGPIDLGAELLGSGEAIALRLALFGMTLGLLALAADRSVAEEGGDRWSWVAVGLVLAAAAAVDLPWLAAPLLLAAGGSAGRWLCSRDLGSRPGSFSALVLIAVLISAVGWELGYRSVLRAQVATELLAGMGPPGPRDLEALAGGIEGFLGRLDLSDLTPRPTAGMRYDDLAFAVWSSSPLARLDARSALAIKPLDRQAATASAFATGLSLTEDQEIEEPEGGVESRSAAWAHSRIEGVVEIGAGGVPWGSAHWWLQPRPGFALGEAANADEILGALLRGEAVGAEEPAQLPPSVLYALYDRDGQAQVSPWQGAPPAPPALLESPAGGGDVTAVKVETPAGTAWAFARWRADGREVLFLPLLPPGRALLRLATHANGVLLPLTLTALLALLLALPRAAFRDLLRRTMRSYSKRLALVYSLLLLVPLLLLNLVLLRGVERSLLRDRQDRGEQALRAAQRAIQERLLGPEFGFEVRTALSDEVRRLPRMIDHEVNFYWAGDFFDSSSQELVTAGLFPQRIPGDVFARLAILSYGVASRLNDAFDPPFLELYAPVVLDGQGQGDGGPHLVVSVPLQAQQEEDAAVLANLRLQALAYTTALIALLLAVGSHLARNFTRPIQELVAGTRRIAAGATELGLAPSDSELAAIVEAVDDMAARIAEGRHQLLLEKALVEGMVENITPAVVSLDADNRVLMHNRAATELLGVKVGDDLVAHAREVERLAPVADLLSARRGPPGAAGEPARTTVRLAGTDGTGQKEWTVVSVPLPGPGVSGSLLVVEDVTEMLQGQRLAAWAEMARIIAHEIKNPLTPIRLSAEHMRQVYHADPDQFATVFERCTHNILRQVDELGQIASEFSTYAHIPRIERAPGDLHAAMKGLIESYLAAPPAGVEVRFEAAAEPLPAQFDARLLGRAVRNLLENAVRASGGGGEVALRLESRDGHARIAVVDTGPGVPPELVGRIFDPYFSTHDTGTGLGLPIARRIAEEHGGTIVARNRPTGGLVVEIDIPLMREAT